MAAPDPLHVLIVGAGLGGLSCGIACRLQNFRVTILEQAPTFTRLGDSIGFGSNSARLFRRWGCYDALYELSSRATGMRIHNFDSPAVLGVDTQLAEAEARFGCPGLIGHRGDYHRIVCEHAERLGCTVRMGCRVEGYDAEAPSVVVQGGEVVEADVVICADGVKSKGREVVLGYEDAPVHSGYAVYRACMDGSLLRGDPVAGHYVENGDGIDLYLAPDMHGIVSVLRNGAEVNAVVTHKDTSDISEGWSVPGRRKDVLALLAGWSPDVRRVWELMPSLLDWKLVYRPTLPKWVADSGRVAVMGDAAHPFLPTSTQGASQAIEGGATLAVCLKLADGDVPLALHAFFEIRHDYVARAQATGVKQRETWHNLHDKESGKMKAEFDLEAVQLGNIYLWENDAEKTARERWDEVAARVRERLRRGKEDGRA